MSWWMMIPAFISAGAAIWNRGSAQEQNENQYYWNQFNAQRGYQTALTNITNQLAIAKFNAQAAQQQGAVQGLLTEATSQVNAELVRQTSLYNNSLLDHEIDQIWSSYDLDMLLLSQARAQERGLIRATQAASGVVMDQDSAQQVIIGQRTQEALDTLVIRHNADIAVADIMNAKSKNLWEGELTARKYIWEGKMGSLAAQIGASAESASIIGNAYIGAKSNFISANYKYWADSQSAIHSYGANNQNIQNQFVDGLFGSFNQGIQGAYQIKTTKMLANQSQSMGAMLK